MPSFEQSRSQVAGRIWQSIAQSGVDMSAIPADQLQVLVNSIADGVLVAVNEALEEAASAASALGAASEDTEEEILWRGRPFLSLTEHYTLTSERVRVVRGLLAKDRSDIELVRLQDIDHSQGVTERMAGLGDIVLRSHDSSHPVMTLHNVSNPEHVHELIRDAMLKARQKYNVIFREEM